MNACFRHTLLLLLVFAPARAVASEGAPQADSTFVDRWQLENGLDVVAHHVPGARHVAVTLAFRAGSGYESANEQGSAQLLANCWFTAGPGDGPERTLDDMSSLRPEGWDYRVNREVAAFSEVTKPAKLAGVLAEFAERLARPTLSEAGVGRAREAARRTASERYFGDPAQILHYRVRAVAEGVPDADLIRIADDRTLANLRAGDVSARLAMLYVPANAVLTVAGDLGTVDVRGMVTALFAKLPGGARQPRLALAAFAAGTRASRSPGISQPTAVIGLFAPALDDSTHASFLLNMLLLGSALQQGWGAPSIGRTRFAYSVLEEPDLVRVYPPLPASGLPADASRLLDLRFEELGAMLVTADDLEASREHFRWLLGGPMSVPVLSRVRHEPGAVLQLGVNEALRTIGRGPGFWEQYLGWFDLNERDQKSWMPWLHDAAHRAVLVLTPAR